MFLINFVSVSTPGVAVTMKDVPKITSDKRHKVGSDAVSSKKVKGSALLGKHVECAMNLLKRMKGRA